MYQIDLKLIFLINPNTNQLFLIFVSTKLNAFLILAIQYIIYSKLRFIFVRVIHRRALLLFWTRQKASDQKQQNEESGGHEEQAHVEKVGPTSP